MTDKQLIKAEIERRINDLKGYVLQKGSDQRWVTAIDQLTWVKAFIDSLPEEPASEDLEEEINHISKNEYFNFSDWKSIARHFAEWQREKDIKLEKIDDLEEFAQKWAYSNYHEELDEVNCDCLYSGVKKGAEWQKQKSMQDFFEKAEKILTERMYFSDDEAKEFKNYMQDESEN